MPDGYTRAMPTPPIGRACDPAARRDLRWDLFCVVVDNLGDAAIGWRLARQLAAEHAMAPRLWIDRPEALAAMVPGAGPGRCVDGVRIERLDPADPRLARTAPDDVADVVVGLLAGAPPPAYRAAMRARPRRPAWIAFEYLREVDRADRREGVDNHVEATERKDARPPPGGHPAADHVPDQVGGRLSMKAQIPSSASRAIMLRTITAAASA